MTYRTEAIPKYRRFSIDSGKLGRGKNIVHGLLEVDVTVPLGLMEAYAKRTGEKPSFTAFVVKCLAGAISRHDHLHAYQDWRGQLVIYENVNIGTMIETQWSGNRVPMPYVFKDANRKDYLSLNQELRTAQRNPLETPAAKITPTLLAFPGAIRRMVYWVINRVPGLFRKDSSPVLVTAVGMFGKGGGWGIPKPSQTLTVTLGGIEKKPAVHEGAIKIRELLNLTLSINHDIVDGAPATRFANELISLMEAGYGLELLNLEG